MEQVVAFVTVSLAADKFLSRVKDVAELFAPAGTSCSSELLHRIARTAARQRIKLMLADGIAAVILLTFFQTLALLLQIELTWPTALRRLMLYLSYFSKY